MDEDEYNENYVMLELYINRNRYSFEFLVKMIDICFPGFESWVDV